jgi:arsenite methyltransferase
LDLGLPADFWVPVIANSFMRCIVAFVFLPLAAFAQASIQVLVLDPSGAAIPDAGITATLDATGAVRTTRTGPEGRAIGIDMTDAMVEQARNSTVASGMKHVEIRKGGATALPVAGGSVDVVISNGVLNLVPEKELGFSEIVRILRPGGRLHLADIVLNMDLSEDLRHNIDLWTG